MAILALVAAPLLADYLHTWLRSASFGKVLTRSRSVAASRATPFLGFLLLLPLLAFIPKLKAQIYSPPRQEMVGVPLMAVDYMKVQQVTGNTFTDPNIWGGYLIWEMPSNPVYIDGRIDMYGDQFVREYLNIISGLTDWREPFGRYGVRLALISPKSVLRLQLQNSSDWQQVYEDGMAVVFTKR